MGSSNATGNQISRMSLAVQGAKTHAAALPKEAVPLAKELETVHGEANTLNAQQEKLKADLKKVSAELAAKLKKGTALRGRIVKYAEGTFGPRAPEMLAFRPKTEGKAKGK